MHAPMCNGRPFLSTRAGTLGLTPYDLRTAVRRGALRRLLRGVYVDATAGDTRELRIAALALILPRDGVAWGRTAAWMWGIDCFGPGERDLLVPECAVPHHSMRPGHPTIRVVERCLAAGDITELGGVRVTTPLRTALDLARSLDRPMALAALDAFAHAGMVDVAELRQGAARLTHHPGIVQARELIGWVESLTESPGESWLRLRLLDAGFPRPVAQIPLLDERRHAVFRLDLGYPDHRLAVEYDGRDWHGTPAQRARDDRRRQRIVEQFGWQLLSSNLGDVMGRYPAVELAVGEALGLEPVLPRRW
ncbi:MAG: hypothetical protein H0U47_11520 [Nocardioidaceae bacterium]|nr:hypothetical protein [Nocardioidaceae bacterium]